MKLPTLLSGSRIRPFLIVLASLGGVLVLLLVSTPQAAPSLAAFFVTPWTTSFFLGNLLDSASVSGLAALGFLMGRKAGLFNLGGEGFMYAGALCTAALAPFFAGGGIAGTILLLVLASLAGGFAGLLAHVLRRRLGIHEIISTYLISLALISLGNSLISGPLRNPEGNLLASKPVESGLQALMLLPPSRLNLLCVLFPLLAMVLYRGLNHTRWGYELRLIRSNPELAASQGVNSEALRRSALIMSSAIPALAGSILVLGSHHAAFTGISGGQGWNGIAVAMLAQDNPLASIAAAVFMAWIQSGLQAAQVFTTLGNNAAVLIQGAVILAIAISMGRKGKGR